MRSIRVRLLLMLLALVTCVVGGLSWYVYEQTVLLLRAKEIATERLIKNQCEKQIDAHKEGFNDRLVHHAEQLGRQAYEKVELKNHVNKMQGTHVIATLTSIMANPLVQACSLPAVAQGLSNNSSRMVFPIYANRSIIVNEDALDGDENYLIWTNRASLRSKNLPEDCFASERKNSESLHLYEPRIHEETLRCGKRFVMVTLKIPVFYSRLYSGVEIGRLPPGPRRTPSRTGTSDSRIVPAQGALVVQLARETDIRDKSLNEFVQEMHRDQIALKAESEQVRKDTLNRLILICLATISLCALAITWVTRDSLAPLVNVADAVTDLTPKDLRLKLHGEELDPRKMPEELSPIVQRLQESLDSLDKAFAREKRATADISHELRTPLASLLTTIQVALRKPRTPEEYKATLKQCVETGSHMTILVERLLVLSRLDAGVDQLRKEEVNIVELAGQCVDMIRPIADQRQISIEMDVDDSANMLEPQLTDAAKLREVLVNLIDNAVHYNKDNGAVTLRISAAPKSVILEVIDTGVGMTPETQAQLFERFYRADPSRQSETVNAGLGLAIVKGYIDLFGGTISVNSVPGKGSTFRVALPRLMGAVPVYV